MIAVIGDRQDSSGEYFYKTCIIRITGDKFHQTSQCTWHAEVTVLLRPSNFWDVTQYRLVVIYRSFDTTYRSHLQGSCSLFMYPSEHWDSCTEYQTTWGRKGGALSFLQIHRDINRVAQPLLRLRVLVAAKYRIIVMHLPYIHVRLSETNILSLITCVFKDVVIWSVRAGSRGMSVGTATNRKYLFLSQVPSISSF